MVRINEAYVMAKSVAQDFELLETYETDSAWIFDFGKIGKDGKLFPGAPNISVNKIDGEVKHITIPPVENIKIFRNAKKLGVAWLGKIQ